MRQFKPGTPAYGIFLGTVLAATGALILLIGFWKTLLLAALFGVGYFLGTVGDKGKFFRETANRIVPERKEKPINMREEIAREQEAALRGMEAEVKTPEEGKNEE